VCNHKKKQKKQKKQRSESRDRLGAADVATFFWVRYHATMFLQFKAHETRINEEIGLARPDA